MLSHVSHKAPVNASTPWLRGLSMLSSSRGMVVSIEHNPPKARKRSVRIDRFKRWEYWVGGQSSNTLMRAGRHVLERDVRMDTIAVGVKGLLRMRRESLVVCALRIDEASERRASGFGGFGIVGIDGELGVSRVFSKL